MADHPPQVEAFHTALKRLVPVEEVNTGFQWLEPLTPDMHWMLEVGNLPHALLRRTKGGLPNEAWANTEITLTHDPAGWRALEFLAWWVRDQSRGGEQIQMRPVALPPKGFEVQFGHTLKFVIDHFAICPDGPTPMLELLASRAADLSQVIDQYKEILGPLIRDSE